MKIVSIAVVHSLMVTALTSCNTFVPRSTGISTSTKTVLPTSTNTSEPMVTPTETPVPQYTKTTIPSTFVDIQDGKQLINNQYGFIITLPSNIDILNFNPTDDKLLSTQFSTKNLSDGGQIFTYFKDNVLN